MMYESQGLISFCVLLTVMSGALSQQCGMEDDECEFWLEISHRLTMMDDRYAVYPFQGRLYRFDVPENAAEPSISVNPNKVIVADGWERQKLIVAVNGTMPGPAIEVYEGQTVVVHVKNAMTSSAVTIHWHGIHQIDTPWMDGVAFVTQCPINPGQTFTYRFKASPAGTLWYHSHIGTQFGMGLLGPLIVREKKPMPMEEHIMVLQDWNHNFDSDVTHFQMLYGSYLDRQQQATTRTLDGTNYSMFKFHSGLINGRGRYLETISSSNMTPLTVFNVTQGQPYRFRVIGASTLYPFRVSIDGHNLILVSSDGYDLKPLEVESFVINSGERYDFVITANQAMGNYWIRAETLEVEVTRHIALGILRYSGAPEEDPVTERRKCLENDVCIVANCPYSYYRKDQFTDCINFDEIKGNTSYSTPGATDEVEEKIEELFINFAFPGDTDPPPSSANGVQYKAPASPALTQPKDVTTFCTPEDDCGEQKICQCSQSLTLEYRKVYQVVITNMGQGAGWAHPVHMHGHSFQVVKMGYPEYDKNTGLLLAENEDIDCGGNVSRSRSFCNRAKWSNTSWGGNNIPGLELDHPPVKDTIIIPNEGYAVIRIRADNPGVWFMHCHVELHNVDGMALMLNEASERHKPPPKGFPRCGNFYYSDKDTGSGCCNDCTGFTKSFKIAIGLLISSIFIL